MRILVINGPNLNLLGKREPEIYGKASLSEIQNYTEEQFKDDQSLKLDWYQSNHEGEIIEKIHEVVDGKYDGLIINPAAYSHTSVAIYDAMLAINCKIVEVHLTNTNRRDSFRQRKLTAKAADMIMEGLGKDTYHIAIKALMISKE